MIALIGAAFVGACASGGSSVLSSTSLTAEDLATANYETVYDLMRAHNRVRLISIGGDEYLSVYARGGNIRSGQVSRGDAGFGQGVGADTESQSAGISGTAPGESFQESLLIMEDREVQGNVTQILRSIRLSDVETLDILRPSETSARYGGDGRVGALVITMKGEDVDAEELENYDEIQELLEEGGGEEGDGGGG
jgi:hypothetical protein